MADLKLDSIEGRTSGTITEVGDLKYQIATAWVNFSGQGTVAIRDAYNVSSVTDNGTGNYNINFSTVFDNANYSCVLQIGDPAGAAHGFSGTDSGGYNSSTYNARTRDSTNTQADVGGLSVTVFGGKN